MRSEAVSPAFDLVLYESLPASRAASSALPTAFQTTTTEAQIMHMPIARGCPQDSTRSCGEKTEMGDPAVGDNHADHGGWPEIPRLTGVIECPTLLPDGTFLRDRVALPPLLAAPVVEALLLAVDFLKERSPAPTYPSSPGRTFLRREP